MNTRVLRNLVLISKYGSIAKAASEAHLTSQALGAQLRTAEKRFGFTLFDRTPCGLVLTDKGRRLFPHIQYVTANAEYFEKQIACLGADREPVLRIALNSTYGPLTNLEVVRALRRNIPDRQFEFTLGETDSNVGKFERAEADAAVVIGAVGADTVAHELTNADIDVVFAANRFLGRTDVALDTFFIVPSRSCPYSESADGLKASLPFKLDYRHNTVYSESEALTLNMIQSCSAIGIVSRRNAEQNGLICFDGTHTLKSYVIVASSRVDERVVKCLNSTLGAREETSDEKVGRNSNQYGDREIL